jgi:hypothetical protein
MNPNGKENGFSVEMKSRENVDAISFSGNTDGVLIEGTLGKLEELGMFEEAVLIVEGTKGTLSVDLTPDDLRKIVSKEVKKGE